jgi:hypothetical protein
MCAEINNAAERVKKESELISKVYLYLDFSYIHIKCTIAKEVSTIAKINRAFVNRS